MTTLAERRHRARKAKARARNVINNVWLQKDKATPRQIGRQATMHNTCPCWMCTTKFDEESKRTKFDPRFHETMTGRHEGDTP